MPTKKTKHRLHHPGRITITTEEYKKDAAKYLDISRDSVVDIMENGKRVMSLSSCPPPTEEDERIYELEDRVEELEIAIRKHREQTSHNMCWENDEELWAVLNDGIKIDHTPPSWCEFMTKCAEYRASKDKK